MLWSDWDWRDTILDKTNSKWLSAFAKLLSIRVHGHASRETPFATIWWQHNASWVDACITPFLCEVQQSGWVKKGFREKNYFPRNICFKTTDHVWLLHVFLASALFLWRTTSPCPNFPRPNCTRTFRAQFGLLEYNSPRIIMKSIPRLFVNIAINFSSSFCRLQHSCPGEHRMMGVRRPS